MNIIVPPTIEVTEPDDEQLLDAVRLGEAMWSESPVYGGMKQDIAKMIEFAYNARASDHSFFNVVTVDNSCYGFMIGERAPYGFHDSEFAYDRLLYVTPTRRGSVAARMLIQAFEDWCKLHGVGRIMLGVTTGVHAAQTEKFYNKLGYQTIGTLTMKEI